MLHTGAQGREPQLLPSSHSYGRGGSATQRSLRCDDVRETCLPSSPPSAGASPPPSSVLLMFLSLSRSLSVSRFPLSYRCCYTRVRPLLLFHFCLAPIPPLIVSSGVLRHRSTHKVARWRVLQHFGVPIISFLTQKKKQWKGTKNVAVASISAARPRDKGHHDRLGGAIPRHWCIAVCVVHIIAAGG